MGKSIHCISLATPFSIILIFTNNGFKIMRRLSKACYSRCLPPSLDASNAVAASTLQKHHLNPEEASSRFYVLPPSHSVNQGTVSKEYARLTPTDRRCSFFEEPLKSNLAILFYIHFQIFPWSCRDGSILVVPLLRVQSYFRP